MVERIEKSKRKEEIWCYFLIVLSRLSLALIIINVLLDIYVAYYQKNLESITYGPFPYYFEAPKKTAKVKLSFSIKVIKESLVVNGILDILLLL